MSYASDELAKVVKRHGASEVARRLGVSEGIVRHWAKGFAPRSNAREQIEATFGIAAAGWASSESAPPGSPATALFNSPAPLAPAPSPAPAGGAVDAKALVLELLGQLRRALARCENDSGTTARELAQLATSATSAMRLYSRLSGELEISNSQVARSAPFQRIIRVIGEAVSKFPGACQAVERALARELGQEV